MNSPRFHPPPSMWPILALGLGVLAGLIPLLAGGSLLWGGALLLGGVGLAGLAAGWPLSGVALLIVAALFTRFRYDIGPVSVRPEHLAALAVAGLGLTQMAIHRARLRFPLPVGLALGWWGVNLISALFFSPVLLNGVQNALRIGLLILTLFLVANLIPNRRAWWMAITLFLAAGVAEAAFGILARVLYPFGFNLGVQVSWNFTEPIPYGTFEEGNLFGSHIASWATLLLMLLLTAGSLRRPTLRQGLLLAGLGVLLLGLFLSLSRAAWLTFAAGAALIWVFHRGAAWHAANRLALLLAAGPFLIFTLLGLAPFLPSSWPFVDRLQSFLSLSSDPTFAARLNDWALAWNDWLQRPLTGWGPGSFADLHGLIRANPAWISNLGLRLLQETGIIGLLLFGGYLFTLILPALKRSRRLPLLPDGAALFGLTLAYLLLIGLAYQSTDGIWLAASWVHAGLILAGVRVLTPEES